MYILCNYMDMYTYTYTYTYIHMHYIDMYVCLYLHTFLFFVLPLKVTRNVQYCSYLYENMRNNLDFIILVMMSRRHARHAGEPCAFHHFNCEPRLMAGSFDEIDTTLRVHIRDALKACHQQVP